MVSLLPTIVLHYNIFLSSSGYLEFFFEVTDEVSVTCMLNFRMKTAIMSTVSLHELHIDLLKL